MANDAKAPCGLRHSMNKALLVLAGQDRVLGERFRVLNETNQDSCSTGASGG